MQNTLKDFNERCWAEIAQQRHYAYSNAGYLWSGTAFAWLAVRPQPEAWCPLYAAGPPRHGCGTHQVQSCCSGVPKQPAALEQHWHVLLRQAGEVATQTGLIEYTSPLPSVSAAQPHPPCRMVFQRSWLRSTDSVLQLQRHAADKPC